MKRNWEYKKLGDVCDVKTGKLDANASNENGKYPFFTCSKEPLRIDSYSYDLECVLLAGNGDLNVKYYQGKFDAYQRTYIISLKKNVDWMSTKFVYAFFQRYVDVLRKKSIGGVIKYIKLGDITNASLPVPTLSEQSRIVAELDLLTGIIDKQNAQLKELDNLAQTIFYDMFGDPIENPKGWEVKKLGDACLSITDGDHMPPPKVDQGIPFLTISDIDKETRILNFENTFHVPEEYFISLKDDRKAQVGDLLYTVTGSYGIPVIITEKRDFCFQRHIALLKPKKDALNAYFLCYWVLCKSVKLMADGVATGIAQKTVGLGSIRKFDIILPPLALQQSFAEKIQSIEKQKETIRASIADTQKLLDYTMDKYFG